MWRRTKKKKNVDNKNKNRFLSIRFLFILIRLSSLDPGHVCQNRLYILIPIVYFSTQHRIKVYNL